MDVISSFDNFILRVVRRAVDFWSEWTGETNIALAKILLLIAIFFRLIRVVFFVLADQSMPASILFGFDTVVALSLYGLFYAMLEKIKMKSASDIAPMEMSMYYAPLTILFRSIFLISYIIMMPASLQAISSICFLLHFYVAVCSNSGGKSRLKEAVKSIGNLFMPARHPAMA
ncbi:MAG: hypothetical protein HYV65_00255 [Candidatus Spechtbacteria bacterium]|nr:hypothetical protein [Candidatus Spechtbacteria bacterium]